MLSSATQQLLEQKCEEFCTIAEQAIAFTKYIRGYMLGHTAVVTVSLDWYAECCVSVRIRVLFLCFAFRLVVRLHARTHWNCCYVAASDPNNTPQFVRTPTHLTSIYVFYGCCKQEQTNV
jgi:hypothetical protein